MAGIGHSAPQTPQDVAQTSHLGTAAVEDLGHGGREPKSHTGEETMEGWRRLTLVLVLALLGTALGAGCGISTDTPTGQDSGKSKGTLSIKNLRATNIKDTEATITWSTSEATVGTVKYGRDATLSVTQTASVQIAREQHEVTVDGLLPETTYYYRVAALSTRGDTTSSRGTPFITLPDQELNDQTAPVITGIQVVGVTSSSAEIHWKTDDRTRGKIHYDLTHPFANTATEFPTEPTRYERDHALVLTELQDSTTYYFSVDATNKANKNTVTTQDLSFTTLGKPTIAICPDVITVGAGTTFDLGLCILNAKDVHGVALIVEYDPHALEILPNGGGSREGPDWGRTQGHLIQPVADLDPGLFGIAATWKIQYSGNTPLGTLADGDIQFYTMRCRVLAASGTIPITFYEGTVNGDPDPEYPSLYDHHRLVVSFHLRTGEVQVMPAGR
jgi:hypothetical protein